MSETFHGVEIVDPYHWLEDQSSGETRAWIDGQNAYAHALLDGQPVRAGISQRLTEMLRHDQVSAAQGGGGPDELPIDPAPLSADHRTSVGVEDISEDGNLLAYSVRQGGEDETEVHVFRGVAVGVKQKTEVRRQKSE